MRQTLAIVFAAAVAGGLLGVAVGLALGGGRPTDDPRPPSAALDTAVTAATRTTAAARTAGAALAPEAIYRAAAPGVVVITDTQTRIVPPTVFTPGGTQQVGALGSGFVVDRRGDVVTNAHVVQGSTNIRVGFSGGATYPATIVGSDPTTDIAVVRVSAPAAALHPLAFGRTGSVEVGDRVYAIGNPFGLERTMTAGIVSATGRDIRSPDGRTIAGAIQTDAPINHGNSGGPLLDRFGRVIGINAQLQAGTVDANVGIGFAVPGSTARTVARQLIESGHAEHAWLGVEIETIDPGVASAVRGLPPRGVVVVKVTKGSPAARAGIRAATRQVTVNGVSAFVGGDSIVALDGTPVTSTGGLGDLLSLRRPGDRVRLTVVRGSTPRTVEVALGNVPG